MSELFTRRLGERLDRASVPIASLDLGRLERYYKLLEKWNGRVNLTALPLSGFPPEALDRLFVEPLIAADLIKDEPYEWLDLGSGNGSPAIPLKLVRPQPRLTMVESVGKKATFLREIVRSLELRETRVVATRIESVAKELFNPRVQLVTVRGVRLSAEIVAALLKLLYPTGYLLRFGVRSDTPPAGFREMAQRTLTEPDSVASLLAPA